MFSAYGSELLPATVASVKKMDEKSPVTAPRIWNDLPDDVRSAKSLSSFRKKLKTYLFEKAYPP